MVTIALGQLNTTVGDLDGNVARMAQCATRAEAAGADLICFPELAVTGYPPEDLVLRPGFVTDNLQALGSLAEQAPPGIAVVAGFIDTHRQEHFNAAALLRNGLVEAVYRKIQLPNFGVFDERRYFVPGESGVTVKVAGEQIGLSVCEDAWHDGLPFADYVGLPLIVNINGSPYHRGKRGEREDVLRARALQTGSWIVYVNTVGGQDELVFDGGSLIMAPDGTVTQRAAMFDEEVLFVQIPTQDWVADPRAPWPEGPEEVYRALVTGLRDYVLKNGFEQVVVGLSGGIDSAMTAALAADALGPDSVRALAMPSLYSSPESLEDAINCAEQLGIRIDTIPIDEILDRYGQALAGALAGRPSGVTEENLQARIRGTMLMALSNRSGAMVLATGNKSEYAVGYSTLYGDMAGGFAPIKDVPKTLVYELARWRNAQPGFPPIPGRTITKPPSAELRPDQKDTDSLPPYEELDPIIELYVEDDLGPDEIVARGHSPATVQRVIAMIDRAEYKRRQAAPGVKITPKAFGRDRRMPITNRFPG